MKFSDVSTTKLYQCHPERSRPMRLRFGLRVEGPLPSGPDRAATRSSPQIFIAVAIQSRELPCTVRHSQQHGGISTRAYALAQYDRRAKLGFLLENLLRQIALGGVGNDGG